jgi:hypothetical protein
VSANFLTYEQKRLMDLCKTLGIPARLFTGAPVGGLVSTEYEKWQQARDDFWRRKYAEAVENGKAWEEWFAAHEHLAITLPSGTKCYCLINFPERLFEPEPDVIVEKP